MSSIRHDAMKTGLSSTLQHPPSASRQRGVSIISALFMLLLFAALAAYMVSLTSTSNITSAQDIQGARAYQAAQAGLEWGLIQVLDPANTTVVSPLTATWPHMPVCPADTTLTLFGFSVTVHCERFPLGVVGVTGPPVYLEEAGTRSIIVYQLTARASTTGGVVGSVGFVERQVSAFVSKCRAADGVVPGYACP